MVAVGGGAIPEIKASVWATYPYYGASGVIDHVDDYLFDEPLLLLSEDGANLLNRSTPIAFVAEGRYWVNNHAHVLKPYDGVDGSFLAYALADVDVSAFNFASAQAKLNQANAKRIEIPLPPPDEQVRVAQILDRLGAKAKFVTALHHRADQLWQALGGAVMQTAFRNS